MPFTLSHPAAILPLLRYRRSLLLPLVTGSIAPDLQYFLPQAVTARLPETHTLLGILVGSPLAALLWLALVRLLRRPLVRPLPGRHRVLAQEALDAFGERASDWIWAVPAILAGALLHLVWDSFTHAYGWPVHHWALLRSPVEIASASMVLFHALQWLSSILGLAILGAAYARALRKVPAPPPPDRIPRARSIGLLAALAVTIAVAVHRVQDVPPIYRSLYGMTFIGLTTAMATFAVAYVLLGVVLVAVDATHR